MAIAFVPPTKSTNSQNINIDTSGLNVAVQLFAELDLTAQEAKRKVTRYFLDNITMFIGPKQPRLVLTDQGALVWCFPLCFYHGTEGEVGLVGEVDVDARTGQLLIDDPLREKIETNARILAKGATLQTNA